MLNSYFVCFIIYIFFFNFEFFFVDIIFVPKIGVCFSFYPVSLIFEYEAKPHIRWPHIREYEAGESGANFTSVNGRTRDPTQIHYTKSNCAEITAWTIISPQLWCLLCDHKYIALLSSYLHWMLCCLKSSNFRKWLFRTSMRGSVPGSHLRLHNLKTSGLIVPDRVFWPSAESPLCAEYPIRMERQCSGLIPVCTQPVRDGVTVALFD